MSLSEAIETTLNELAGYGNSRLLELLRDPEQERWVAAALQLGAKLRRRTLPRAVSESLHRLAGADDVLRRRVLVALWGGGLAEREVERFIAACCCLGVAEGYGTLQELPQDVQSALAGYSGTDAVRLSRLAETLNPLDRLWEIRTVPFALALLPAEVLAGREQLFIHGYIVLAQGPVTVPWLLYRWQNRLADPAAIGAQIERFFAGEFFDYAGSVLEYSRCLAEYLQFDVERRENVVTRLGGLCGFDPAAAGLPSEDPARCADRLLALWQQGAVPGTAEQQRSAQLFSGALLDSAAGEQQPAYWVQRFAAVLHAPQLMPDALRSLAVNGFCRCAQHCLSSGALEAEDLLGLCAPLFGGFRQQKHDRSSDLRRVAVLLYLELRSRYRSREPLLLLLLVLFRLGRDHDRSFVNGCRRYLPEPEQPVFAQLCGLLEGSSSLRDTAEKLTAEWFQLLRTCRIDVEQAERARWLWNNGRRCELQRLPVVLQAAVAR